MKFRGIALVVAALVSAQPLSASVPGGALESALNARGQRMKNVEIYVERIRGGELPGMSLGGPCVSIANCRVYKIETVVGPDGTTTRQERVLSPIEVQVLAGLSPSADFVEIYGAAMIDVQQMFNERTGGEDMADVAEGLDDPESRNAASTDSKHHNNPIRNT